MELQPWTLEGATQNSCNTIEVYEEDYYTMKMRDLSKSFGWRSPQYNIKPEKNPGQLCTHKCELTVHTTPSITSNEQKRFLQLNNKYLFDTGDEKFIIPYEAMEYVAKIAFYNMKELTGYVEECE